MAYRGIENLNNPQLLWRQESSSFASSQSCSGSSAALHNGEFGFGDGGGPGLGTLQRRCSSLPTGTVIKHLPCSSRPHHSSASRLDTLEHQDSNVLIHLLLEKVMALTAEKHRLSEQNTALAMENQQLSSLVTDMSDTLQQQQAQMRSLLALQRQRLIKAASRTPQPQQTPPQHSQHRQQQLMHAAAGRPPVAPSMVAAMQPSWAAAAAAAAAAARAEEEECEEDLTEISASLPFLPPQSCPQPLQQQQVQHSQRRQQQERVAEWLQEKGWQQFQEKLEPVSSSSSSSLILAIEETLRLH